MSASNIKGIERLCACTDKGKLQFFDLKTVSDKQVSFSSPDQGEGAETNSEGSACKRAKMDEDVVDHQGKNMKMLQLLKD